MKIYFLLFVCVTALLFSSSGEGGRHHTKKRGQAKDIKSSCSDILPSGFVQGGQAMDWRFKLNPKRFSSLSSEDQRNVLFLGLESTDHRIWAKALNALNFLKTFSEEEEIEEKVLKQVLENLKTKEIRYLNNNAYQSHFIPLSNITGLVLLSNLTNTSLKRKIKEGVFITMIEDFLSRALDSEGRLIDEKIEDIFSVYHHLRFLFLDPYFDEIDRVSLISHLIDKYRWETTPQSQKGFSSLLFQSVIGSLFLLVHSELSFEHQELQPRSSRSHPGYRLSVYPSSVLISEEQLLASALIEEYSLEPSHPHIRKLLNVFLSKALESDISVSEDSSPIVSFIFIMEIVYEFLDFLVPKGLEIGSLTSFDVLYTYLSFLRVRINSNPELTSHVPLSRAKSLLDQGIGYFRTQLDTTQNPQIKNSGESIILSIQGMFKSTDI